MKNNDSLMQRNLFNKGDLLIILVILLFGCIIFFVSRQPAEGDLTANIYENGKIIKTINLEEVNEPYNFTIGDENNLIIRVEKGRIRYLSSSCKDNICVKTGWLSNHGDFAACAPLKSAISVSGKGSGGNKPDFILS